MSEPQGLSRATKAKPYPNSIPYTNEPLTIGNRVFREVATKYLNQFFLLLHSYGFDTQRFLDDTLNPYKIQQRNIDAITALRLGAAEMGPDMKKGEAAAFIMTVWPDKQDSIVTQNPHNIMCLFTTTIRMIKAARDHKTIPIDLCAPCKDETNNDESVGKISKPFKATFAHLSSLFKRINLRTDHPFMHSIVTLTRKKGFLTILVKKDQGKYVKWASEDLLKVIRAVWTIGTSKGILLQRFGNEKDALNWLSSEGCGPACALSSSTGDGGLPYLVKGLQSQDCQCVGSYLGRQEPAYNDANALDVAAKATAAWKLFKLVQKESTVPGSMKPTNQGVMTSLLGVLGADENGGVTLNKEKFMDLTKAFLDQINAAKKQGKTDGRKWTEYLTKQWGKKQTMVQKATLIARCMVAFHWMCQTHHVQYEGFNDYHGRRQHVVRKKAGKLMHEEM
ncbi:hypothetical protein TrRE_jg4429, partial [Triparma retinervis]